MRLAVVDEYLEDGDSLTSARTTSYTSETFVKLEEFMSGGGCCVHISFMTLGIDYDWYKADKKGSTCQSL